MDLYQQKTSREPRLRALSLSGGTRQTSLRLDGITWSAIDLLAARQGIRWQDWATRIIDANSQTGNMAGELRQAVIEELLDATIGHESSVVTLPEHHAILGASYHRVHDQVLDTALIGASVLHRDDSFVSFSVIVGGLDGDAPKPFLCIQNRLQGEPHLLAVVENFGGGSDA
ncbi:conserved hypothetical protein [Candidatus Accumulibacter aalborgensis]|uniref:Uncharacterized protein n=1 Tax=Candidatus Accumulibacter aalborgensis TaxID=1860102 RepID=A0A1A8XIW3_9PROT|nr:ribbon-helix-helix domain-containing protein [Candidatus Accumulibacter aalborgensis]SBT03888.1 conserved hypothetical protein [Candidatus Accumulibacter aalborgensis]